ncbi:MAG: N-acetylmuramic acid 6-phosphate etherase [Crocinitomicaceae bacterium]
MTTRITEQNSLYNDLEKMSPLNILEAINHEDKKVALAVEKCIPQLDLLVSAILPKMKDGGRLFYIGAGTSGRLGIVDASECPPTFGVSPDIVNGIIAGGDSAIRNAVEFAEDSTTQGWEDLNQYNFSGKDSLIGIAASGTTPYVISAIEKAKSIGAVTAGITNNPNSPLSKICQFPIVPIVGPEFITGSTRMKSGTSQKLVLNMISTTLMIGLGKVKGNKMIDMQLSNDKLIARGQKMIMEATHVNADLAAKLLEKHGNVRDAIEGFQKS